MSIPLIFKRGLAANRVGITPSDGQPLYDTDTKKLYIGDGTTAGGNPATFIPTGGTTDQVLAKNSATDHDLKWASSSGAPNLTLTALTLGNYKIEHNVGNDTLDFTYIG